MTISYQTATPNVDNKHLSKNSKNCKQHVSQVIAAEQLMKEGAEVKAGKNLSFLFIDSENKRFDCIVRAEQLRDKGVNAATKKHVQLLYSSTVNLLSFSHYTTPRVYDSIRRYQSNTLTSYLDTELIDQQS